MGQFNNSKILGAEKKRSLSIKNLEANDKIILFSTLNINKRPIKCFIAYTMVEETFEDDKKLYNKYAAPKKLKLKGVKYFTDPIPAKDLVKDLEFIKNPKKFSNDLKSEYKEISKKDFKKILLKSNITKEYPAYFENVSYKMDEFILNSIKALFVILSKTEKRNQIEIISFLKLLKKFLQQFGISRSYDEIADYYSKNAWKLGFKHYPSRDPDKFFYLFSQDGKKVKFTYISLNKGA